MNNVVPIRSLKQKAVAIAVELSSVVVWSRQHEDGVFIALTETSMTINGEVQRFYLMHTNAQPVSEPPTNGTPLDSAA